MTLTHAVRFVLALIAILGTLVPAQADIAWAPSDPPGRHILFFENLREFPDHDFYLASPAADSGYLGAGPIRIPDYRTVAVEGLNRSVRLDGLYLFAVPHALLAGGRPLDFGWFRGPNPTIPRSERIVDPETARPSGAPDLITTLRVSLAGGELRVTELDPGAVVSEAPELPPHAPQRGVPIPFVLAASGSGLCLVAVGLLLARRRKAARA